MPGATLPLSKATYGCLDIHTGGPAWKIVRAGERVMAAALLIGSFPILLPAAICVRLLSKRTPLVAHRRVGHAGRDMWVLKLRTMWEPGPVRCDQGAVLEYLPEKPIPKNKRDGDVRVTSRFAALCRKYSIDELPQLWHVIAGEMALVGPRPLTRMELADHYGSLAPSILRLKPGITGLWQIRGRNKLTYKQRKKLDVFLLSNWSLGLYFRILFASIPRVLTGRDAF
jgi:exopolysaccharide production protein ExoY